MSSVREPRWREGLSLRRELLILFCVLAIVPLVAVMVFGYSVYRGHLVEQRREVLAALAEQHRHHMDAHLAERYQQLLDVALELNRRSQEREVEELVEDLRWVRRSVPEFAMLLVLDPTGRIISSSSSSSSSSTPHLPEAVLQSLADPSGPRIGSPVYAEAAGGLVIPVAVSMDLELEAVRGPLTLVGKLYWSDIFEHVQETVVREDDGSVSRFGLYVDRDGSVLAAPVFLLAELEPLEAHGLFKGDAVPSPAEARSVLALVEDSTYALVVAREEENPTPDPPPGGYAGWDANVLLFEKPEVATAPLEAFVRGSLGVLLFAAGLSFILAGVFAKRLTAQLGLLVEATEVMRTGQQPDRVRVLVRNELGTLTTQFNHMVEEIVGSRAALERRAAEMESANRRLRELDELKTRLLSNVSHELRTPLAAISAAAKVIAKYHVTKPEVAERFSATIVTESNRLGRLIDDFLDLTKIESGSMPWSDSAVMVNDVIEEVVEHFAPLFEEKQILINAQVEPELLPLWVDRDRLVQLLTNLLSNASKYTAAGGHVTVSATRSQNGVTVAVTDSGEGIAEEEIEKIFDKFYQIDTGHGLGLQATGTGLGLAVCKDIVEHYRGRIWVESTIGVGSAFKFTVPTGRDNGTGKVETPQAEVEQGTVDSSTSA